VGYSACGCLVRYIHLNPLRAKLVNDLAALERYPWCGHRTLLGRRPQPWQTVDEVLGQFARQVGEARRRYRQFVAEGVAQGRRAALQGGGLRRSAGGWEGLAALRRGRERWTFDERVLGSGPFVDRLLAEVGPPPGSGATRAWPAFPRVIARLAQQFGVSEAELTGGSRRRPVAAARAAVGAVAVTGLGLPAARAARALGVTTMPLLRSLARGAAVLSACGLRVETVAQEALRKG